MNDFLKVILFMKREDPISDIYGTSLKYKLNLSNCVVLSSYDLVFFQE